MSTTTNLNSLRQELLRKYPQLRPQQRHASQCVWFFVLLLWISALTHFAWSAVVAKEWVSAVLVSLVLGMLYSSLGLFAHELLHGSILKTSWVTRVMAWFGFLIFGLSPELWLTWHNRVHHFNTNKSGVDPDTFGLWDEFQHYPMAGFILKRAPGSGHLLSWLYLPLNFSNQALTVMWYFLWKGDPKLYGTVNRPLAVIETLLMYAFWAVLGWQLGWRTWFLVFLVPALIANLVVSGYILVQHLFCPLTETNDPLENTLGVQTLPWLDFIHFRFSHHVEHHIFPELNHTALAELRTILRRDYPKRYRLMPHHHALRVLLAGPRVYRDAQTLWEPESRRSRDVSGTGRARGPQSQAAN